jgi:hypothetical protein
MTRRFHLTTDLLVGSEDLRLERKELFLQSERALVEKSDVLAVAVVPLPLLNILASDFVPRN